MLRIRRSPRVLRQLLLLLLLRRRRMASYRRDALLGHGPVSSGICFLKCVLCVRRLIDMSYAARAPPHRM